MRNVHVMKRRYTRCIRNVYQVEAAGMRIHADAAGATTAERPLIPVDNYINASALCLQSDLLWQLYELLLLLCMLLCWRGCCILRHWGVLCGQQYVNIDYGCGSYSAVGTEYCLELCNFYVCVYWWMNHYEIITNNEKEIGDYPQCWKCE